MDAIAEKYNIGASTVSEICKRRLKIEQAIAKNKMNGIMKHRKTLRGSNKPEVETELYNWYLELDVNPTQNDFIVKAKEINNQLNHEEGIEEDEWNPSKGWLLRFKDRYGIKPDAKPQVEHFEEKNWQTALEAASFLLDYISVRDYQLKDVITVRMIRDRIGNEPDVEYLSTTP